MTEKFDIENFTPVNKYKLKFDNEISLETFEKLRNDKKLKESVKDLSYFKLNDEIEVLLIVFSDSFTVNICFSEIIVMKDNNLPVEEVISRLEKIGDLVKKYDSQIKNYQIEKIISAISINDFNLEKELFENELIEKIKNSFSQLGELSLVNVVFSIHPNEPLDDKSESKPEDILFFIGYSNQKALQEGICSISSDNQKHLKYVLDYLGVNHDKK